MKKAYAREAFTLLELMVYLSTFSLIIMISFHMISTARVAMAARTLSAKWHVSLYGAQEYIRRELECAPSTRSAWQHSTDDELVVVRDGVQIRIGLAGDRLVRTKRYWHGTEHQPSSSTSTLAAPIREIHVAYDWRDEHLSGVYVELVGDYGQKSYTSKQYVYIPNSMTKVHETNNIND